MMSGKIDHFIKLAPSMGISKAYTHLTSASVGRVRICAGLGLIGVILNS